MTEALSSGEVARIAALARLELTTEEQTLFARQLAEILTYATAVQRVDTSDVPPTTHVPLRPGPGREDEPRASLPRQDALANAPDPAPDIGLFRVPKVIG